MVAWLEIRLGGEDLTQDGEIGPTGAHRGRRRLGGVLPGQPLLGETGATCVYVAAVDVEVVVANAAQLMPTQDREAVGAMLRAAGLIDMIVPRGGKSLVERVQNDARVPVLAHLDGICHTYVHAAADPAMAREVALNAKMRRTGICGAMETLLLDANFPAGARIAGALLDAGCELRGDARAQAIDSRIGPASANDWDTEYLDAVLSVALVDGLDEALDHIARHSSGHTDAIVTSDEAATERFLAEVDSAIVMADGNTIEADDLGLRPVHAFDRHHARRIGQVLRDRAAAALDESLQNI